jgi:hypothetical protein
MMEAGQYGTIDELAAAEKINSPYVSRLLRLTLLAPEIIAMIPDGRQPAEMTLPGLMEPFPADWAGQRNIFGVNTQALPRQSSSSVAASE